MSNLISIEISKKAIKNNITVLRKIVGKNVLLSPCIKANAYGHGQILMGGKFLEAGADYLSVNSVFEAEKLRKNGIKAPILIMGYTQDDELCKLFDLEAKQAVYNLETAQKLSKLAQEKNKNISIHIKVDSGMSRQGILEDNVVNFINAIKALPNIKIEGVFTHFATADEIEDSSFWHEQFSTFSKIIEKIKKENLIEPIFHCSNSATTLAHQQAHLGLVRPGLSTYGYYPSDEVRKVCEDNKIFLQPCLSLKTKVAQIKTIPKGSCVSYGCTYVAKKDTRVAILPIGYYDGLDRRMSNNGVVLINGQRAPILGRVCMNIIIVDVSHIDKVEREDEVVVIGKQGEEEITIDEIAKNIKTINYEVTTKLRESIKRTLI